MSQSIDLCMRRLAMDEITVEAFEELVQSRLIYAIWHRNDSERMSGAIMDDHVVANEYAPRPPPQLIRDVFLAVNNTAETGRPENVSSLTMSWTTSNPAIARLLDTETERSSWVRCFGEIDPSFTPADEDRLFFFELLPREVSGSGEQNETVRSAISARSENGSTSSQSTVVPHRVNPSGTSNSVLALLQEAFTSLRFSPENAYPDELYEPPSSM